MNHTRKLWNEYVEWLREHVPQAHANLAPPATEADIARLEAVIGQPLPEPLAEVWRMNDGQRLTMIADAREPAIVCLPTLSFLSTKLVAQIWRMWDELRKSQSPKELAELDGAARSMDPGRVRPLYTHPGWIPLWSDPTRADYVGVDLAPDEAGVRGQIINFGRDEEAHFVRAESFVDLLELLLGEVRSGAWKASEMPFGNTTIPWFGNPDEHFFNALHRPWQARYDAAHPSDPDVVLRKAGELRATSPAAALTLLDGAGEETLRLLELRISLLQELERYEDLEAAFTRLAGRAPHRASPLPRARNLLYRLRQPERAEEVLRAALARVSHEEMLYLLAMSVGYFQKRYAEGAALMEQVLEFDAEYPSYHANHAYMLAGAGDREGSVAAATRAIQVFDQAPTNNPAPVLKALYYLFALGSEADRATVLARLERMLKAGQRTGDWDFTPIIEAAAGDAEAVWLTKLAEVVNDVAPLEALAQRPAFPVA